MSENIRSIAHYPRLRSRVRLADGPRGDGSFEAAVERTLGRLDGKTHLDELCRAEPSLTRSDVEALVGSLDEADLIDDEAPAEYRSGSEAILELEDLVDECCEATLYQNPFWRACLDAGRSGGLPEKLAVGMIIENWHFLFREGYFDAPVLSYVPNTAVRLLLNEFFSEEYGHDEILLRALHFAGFSREDMHDSIPLPETMGLCNALAHWAHCDPLFFFTTLGLLEGQGMTHDSFIDACERSALPAGLVEPLKTHANINLKAAHGNLTRAVFKSIPVVDGPTFARLKRQTRLFVELYDNLYSAVWRYYTSDAPLLRRVSQL